VLQKARFTKHIDLFLLYDFISIYFKSIFQILGNIIFNFIEITRFVF